MNKVIPRTPNGFVEYLPDDQILFNRIMHVVQGVYAKYGYAPIETPALEFSEVLLAKEGGETEKQIYRFSKDSSDFTMHYDLTVPLARYVAEHYNDLVFPFKRCQTQKVWRAERPQKGRYREFYQSDIDIIGGESVLNDAEIVSVIYEIFHKLGIEAFTVRVNNRKLLNGFLASLNISASPEQVLHSIDKLDKLGEEVVTKELISSGLSPDQIQKIFEFLAISSNASNSEILRKLKEVGIDNDEYKNGLQDLNDITSALGNFQVPEKNFAIDLSIARGLGYYTGTVFETLLTGYEKIGSVCSGGRYDNLLQHFSEQKLTGIGVSIGLSRLFFQLKDAGLLKQEKRSSPASVLIANMSSIYARKCIEIADVFRKNDINTQLYLEPHKLKKQLKYANDLGVPFTVILGDLEVQENKLTLKDMGSGDQKLINCDEAMSLVKQKLANTDRIIIASDSSS